MSSTPESTVKLAEMLQDRVSTLTKVTADALTSEKSTLLAEKSYDPAIMLIMISPPKSAERQVREYEKYESRRI